MPRSAQSSAEPISAIYPDSQAETLLWAIGGGSDLLSDRRFDKAICFCHVMRGILEELEGQVGAT